MDFNLSDDQRMLQENARRYMEKSYPFARREQLVKQGGVSADVWSEFAEMGWLAAAIPECYDGIGFAQVELAILLEELGRGLLLEPFLQHCLFPTSVFLKCASAQQCAQWLPLLGAGEARFVVAHSEPQARGEVAWVETQAQRCEDGGYVINGHKSVVVGGEQADYMLLVARTQGAADATEGLSVFLLPRCTQGVYFTATTLLDGTPAVEVALKNVVVPKEALLGREGEAFSGLRQAVDEVLVYQCAEIVGGMEDVVAQCAQYLKTRKQFGVTIGSFQTLQHRMADMAMENMQARASLYRALASFVAPIGDTARSLVISGCKAQVMKSAKFVTAQGIQLHGGYGLTEEFRVGHHYRRLMLHNTWWGSASYHLTRYAKFAQNSRSAA